jgi:hypothetical protein
MHKNGECIVVDFVCAKSRRMGILHNLSDMRRKPSAGFGLRLYRVPVAYHHLVQDSLWRNSLAESVMDFR